MKLKTTLLALAAFSTLNSQPSTFAQGSLTPPAGAPAPVMKSLAQIEPRTPINATTTPGSGFYAHIISQPGSYFLEGNLTVTNKSGIYIGTNDVTIDLQGFTISNAGGVNGSAILVGAVSNPTILNGNLHAFSSGVYGLAADSGLVKGVCATAFGSMGFLGGASWRFTECSAQAATNANAGITGFSAGPNSSFYQCKVSRISGTICTGFSSESHSSLNLCSANENTATTSTLNGFGPGAESVCYSCEANGNRSVTGGFGFSLGKNSLLKNCLANDNASTGTGISGGYWTDEGVTLMDCQANDNLGINPSTPGRGGVGIYVYGSGMIQNCTTKGNSGDGIHSWNSPSGVKIVNCLSVNNTLSGVHILTGSRNVIESNHVKGNAIGIEITSAGNLIIGNTAAGNTGTNYSIIAGNRYGPIVDLTASGTAAASGNSAVGTTSTTDPRANLAY